MLVCLTSLSVIISRSVDVAAFGQDEAELEAAGS